MKIQESLYQRFKEKVEAVSGECFRVKDLKELPKLIEGILKEKNLKTVAIVESPFIKKAELVSSFKGEFKVYSNQFREVTPTVDAGITEAGWAIAELGTLVQTAEDVNERLASMLPPLHIAIVRTERIIPTLMETLSTLHNLPQIPGFVGFITGPSRTSDIERVLTIGVHGPEQLVVIFVDNVNGEEV